MLDNLQAVRVLLVCMQVSTQPAGPHRIEMVLITVAGCTTAITSVGADADGHKPASSCHRSATGEQCYPHSQRQLSHQPLQQRCTSQKCRTSNNEPMMGHDSSQDNARHMRRSRSCSYAICGHLYMMAECPIKVATDSPPDVQICSV